MAAEIMKKAELQGIAIVENPKNKRCILEPSEYINNINKFMLLKTFLDLNIDFLIDFDIKAIENENSFENKIYPKKDKIK